MLILTPIILSILGAGNLNDFQYTLVLSNGRQVVNKTALSSMQIFIRSEIELSESHQIRFAWHCRNALRLSGQFAKQEDLKILREGVPGQFMLFKTPEGVAQATLLPLQDALGLVVSRTNLRRGVVYLGRSTPEDLYVELGNWFFYSAEYRWGSDRIADERILRLTERFARFCLYESNWTEAGGSREDLR
jgi:hypothetical protein